MLLDESKSWITGKEISRLMNVSDRTIRSDIENINRFYDKQLIESNLRSGYRINMNIPKWRSHLIRQNRATYSNLENHLIQITEPGNPI